MGIFTVLFPLRFHALCYRYRGRELTVFVLQNWPYPPSCRAHPTVLLRTHSFTSQHQSAGLWIFSRVSVYELVIVFEHITRDHKVRQNDLPARLLLLIN